MKTLIMVLAAFSILLTGCNEYNSKAARDNGVNKSFTTGGANADRPSGASDSSDETNGATDNRNSSATDTTDTGTSST